MNAALNKDMKKRSPRVVLIGKNPRRGIVGERISHTVITIKPIPMLQKKAIVGPVQAIHAIRPYPTQTPSRGVF